MVFGKEVICPATGKKCPSQDRGELVLGETCEGPATTQGSEQVEYCNRRTKEHKPNTGIPASKIMANAVKKIRN